VNYCLCTSLYRYTKGINISVCNKYNFRESGQHFKWAGTSFHRGKGGEASGAITSTDGVQGVENWWKN